MSELVLPTTQPSFDSVQECAVVFVGGHGKNYSVVLLLDYYSNTMAQTIFYSTFHFQNLSSGGELVDLKIRGDL